MAQDLWHVGEALCQLLHVSQCWCQCNLGISVPMLQGEQMLAQMAPTSHAEDTLHGDLESGMPDILLPPQHIHHLTLSVAFWILTPNPCMLREKQGSLGEEEQRPEPHCLWSWERHRPEPQESRRPKHR